MWPTLRGIREEGAAAAVEDAVEDVAPAKDMAAVVVALGEKVEEEEKAAEVAEKVGEKAEREVARLEHPMAVWFASTTTTHQLAAHSHDATSYTAAESVSWTIRFSNAPEIAAALQGKPKATGQAAVEDGQQGRSLNLC